MADHLEPKLLTLITALGGTDSLEVNDASLLVALEAKKTKKEPLVLEKHGMSTVNKNAKAGRFGRWVAFSYYFFRNFHPEAW